MHWMWRPVALERKKHLGERVEGAAETAVMYHPAMLIRVRAQNLHFSLTVVRCKGSSRDLRVQASLAGSCGCSWVGGSGKCRIRLGNVLAVLIHTARSHGTKSSYC